MYRKKWENKVGMSKRMLTLSMESKERGNCMIKKAKVFSILTALAISTTVFASCGGRGSDITVISREDGSGTRGAFIELTGVEEKDDAGSKTDNTTVEALIFKSTDVVLTQVSGDENAIGYISLGSLNKTVKALKIGGVEATAQNIENGSYTIVRPFNIVVKSGLSQAAQDFQNFILSKEGQAIVVDNKYVAVDSSAAEFKSNNAAGKVVVAGSSSVSPVMEKLAEAYKKANTDVTIEVQASDSSTGVKSVVDGTCDIGMSSRDLKDSEKSSGIESVVIAKDAIAVVVNKENPIDDLTIEQIKDIYVGNVTSWDYFKTEESEQ